MSRVNVFIVTPCRWSTMFRRKTSIFRAMFLRIFGKQLKNQSPANCNTFCGKPSDFCLSNSVCFILSSVFAQDKKDALLCVVYPKVQVRKYFSNCNSGEHQNMIFFLKNYIHFASSDFEFEFIYRLFLYLLISVLTACKLLRTL